MKFLLGYKQEMSQIFDDRGRAVPVTVVAAEPLAITAVKTIPRDRYAAVQVGYERVRPARLRKPQRAAGYRVLREYRLPDDAATAEFSPGQAFDVSVFAPGDTIAVSGVSKGKGFQGVVKRHGFHGGPRSHGQKHAERKPGSIGGGLRTRVPKGMRMAGRMGGERVTVRNLSVAAVDKENNRLLIRGAVPGRRGTLLEIRG